jgi:hypothetical protein
MPIHLSHNPYRGINAHFNSFLQEEDGGWDAFHHDHIGHLKSLINRALPPGYYALAERTLTVHDEEDHFLGTRRPEVGVFQTDLIPQSTADRAASITPTLEVPMTWLDDDDYLSAVKIYYRKNRRLVTRLELLSPANKRKPHAYLEMRQAMRHSGVNLIEVDYLHEWPNLYAGLLADYANTAPESKPYCITVWNQADKRVRFYCWQVNEALPSLWLPLVEGDSFQLDFDLAYQMTFEDDPRPAVELDYAYPPHFLESYSPDDQARILAVMEQVKSNQS